MSRRNAALHRSDPQPDTLSATQVRSYYSDKTARILAKYGPGPRVHFHSGYCTSPAPTSATPNALRVYMHEAQERLLDELHLHVAGSRLLDVGCGLGGGALYWASRGADVTAITIVPEHVAIIGVLAHDAGVHVNVVERDAHDLEGLGTFDTIVAIESSCYFERRAWFRELRRVLRPGGRVHIVDCFARDRSCVERFDGYWRTAIGSIESYDDAARDARFTRVAHADLGDATLAFWDASIQWSELARRTANVGEARRLRRSRLEHAWLQAALARRRVEYLFASYAA